MLGGSSMMADNAADWAMVIITSIYVVATILICVFNYRSARAASRQLMEMQYQYEEEKRLKFLPYMMVKQIETPPKYNDRAHIVINQDSSGRERLHDLFSFEVTNVGHDLAKNVTWTCNEKNGRCIESIPVNDSRTVALSLCYKYDDIDDQPIFKTVKVEIRYNDLFDKTYKQDLSIFVKISFKDIEIVSHALSIPELVTK